MPCACTLAARQLAQQQQHQQALAQLASDLGQLGSKTLAGFDPTWDAPAAQQLRAALTTCTQYVQTWQPDPAPWLFLGGPPGTGKSHLAAAVALELAQRGQTAYYRSVPAMLNALRAGYRSSTPETSFDARLAAVCTVPVLVLDDLAAEASTESSAALLFEIVDARAMRPNLTTIITSNSVLDQLDFRLASRIRGRAVVITLMARDYRQHVLAKRLAS